MYDPVSAIAILGASNYIPPVTISVMSYHSILVILVITYPQ